MPTFRRLLNEAYFTVTGQFMAKAASPESARAAIGAISAGDVEAVVVAKVAASPTATEAAAVAVNNEIAGRNMLEANDPRVPQDVAAISDLIAAWVDENDLIAIGVDTSGHTWLRLRADVEIPRTPDVVTAYGIAYVITDSDGRVAFSIADDGTVTIPKLDIAELLDTLASGPDINCVGDSMTQGAGGGGTNYPGVLATLTGKTVRNRGVGGETSWTIAARQGATPILATPVGGSIPTSGSVDLTLSALNGQTPAPLLQGGATEFDDVTFAGVQGAVTLVSGTYKFTRTTAGSAVVFNEPHAIIPADAVARRGDIYIIWIGQNNGGTTDGHNRAKADVAALIQEMTAAEKRYLVLSRPTSTDAEDAEWFALYGRRFLSPRKLLNQFGLAEMSITPTSQDTIDIADGIVPVSLRSDATHFNANGYTALARFVHRRLTEFGWV